MKGVYGGLPYPIIWISNFTELEKARIKIDSDDGMDGMAINRGPIKYKEYLEYCEMYINKIKNRNLLSEPYIVNYINRGEIKVSYGKMPKEHRKQINKMGIKII